MIKGAGGRGKDTGGRGQEPGGIGEELREEGEGGLDGGGITLFGLQVRV